MALGDGNTADGSEQSQARLTVRETICSHGKKGLDLLLEAHNYARTLERDLWDFAIELNVLCRAGLSINQLRWLLYQRLVAHGLDKTPRGTLPRTMEPAGAIGFQRASCFILTEAGADFVRQGS